jgi:hypothetical protein
VYRIGLARVIDERPELELVAQVGDGRAAIAAMRPRTVRTHLQNWLRELRRVRPCRGGRRGAATRTARVTAHHPRANLMRRGSVPRSVPRSDGPPATPAAQVRMGSAPDPDATPPAAGPAAHRHRHARDAGPRARGPRPPRTARDPRPVRFWRRRPVRRPGACGRVDGVPAQAVRRSSITSAAAGSGSHRDSCSLDRSVRASSIPCCTAPRRSRRRCGCRPHSAYPPRPDRAATRRSAGRRGRVP